MIPESYGYDDPCNNTAKTPNTDNTTETTDEGQLDNNVGENQDTVKLSNKQAAELTSQLSTKAPSSRALTKGVSERLSEGLSEEEKQHQAHFFAQRFTTEWRICLKRASVDFDRAMQLFWSEVRFCVVCMLICRQRDWDRLTKESFEHILCIKNSYLMLHAPSSHSIYCLGLRGSIKL